jgi:hypothetical protein
VSYVAAGYLVTLVTLSAYGVSLVVRDRRARKAKGDS